MAKQAANDSMKTLINGNWPGVPQVEKKERKQHKPNAPVDLSTVAKTRAPYVSPNTGQLVSKYDALFKGVQEGDCFECPPEKTANLSKALDTYIKKHKIDGVIKQNSRCDDGKGRVWLYKVYKAKAAA